MTYEVLNRFYISRKRLLENAREARKDWIELAECLKRRDRAGIDLQRLILIIVIFILYLMSFPGKVYAYDLTDDPLQCKLEFRPIKHRVRTLVIKHFLTRIDDEK